MTMAMEGKITKKELRFCLFKKMKGSSAPGVDGFTVNWLRIFWPDLESITQKALNDCFDTGTLPAL